MKFKKHIISCCTFWKSSVASKLTLYFMIFGLIIFYVTAVLFYMAERKTLTEAATKFVTHQFSQMERSYEPDFIWSGIGKKQPELANFADMLNSMSLEFHSISNFAIYSKAPNSSSWYRLYLDPEDILRAEPSQESFLEKLNRRRHGGATFRSRMHFYDTEETMTMLLNITGKNDANRYFFKVDVNRQGLAAFAKSQTKRLILFSLIILILSRLIGYRFARKIARPIETLSEGAEAVANGNLATSIQVSTRDELGSLAGNFNQMVAGLRDRERIKVFEYEMEKGREIQREFLPHQMPQIPNWEIATCFFPAHQVSGDFYDAFPLPGNYMGLVIADVCDKGVGSALYMALFRSLIRVFSEQTLVNESPVDLKTPLPQPRTARETTSVLDPINGLKAVALTNNYIATNHGQEAMFATLFFGILDTRTGILTYINGGHEPPFFIGPEGIKGVLMPTGPAVGMLPDSAYNTHAIQFEPGDMLLAYTDGVTEATSTGDKLFSRKRLETIVNQKQLSASELLEQIKSNLFAFTDKAPQNDDITMMAVQWASA